MKKFDSNNYLTNSHNISEDKKILQNTLEQIYQKSQADKIPFVRQKTINLIIKLINDNHFENVLEIGTAYGYSTCAIAIYTDAYISSMEKSTERYEIAHSFLNNVEKITLLNIDCHDFDVEKKYDLIFIDGPKKRQIELFEQFTKFLAPNGIVVIDNIFMKKFYKYQNLTKNQIKLIASVNELKQYLESHNKYRCKIIDIDDGVAILEQR